MNDSLGDDIIVAKTHKYDVGYTQTNRQGLIFTVIAYRNRKDIDVEFEDGFVIEHIRVEKKSIKIH